MRSRLVYIALAVVLLVLGIDLVTRGPYISGKVRTFVIEQARAATGYDVGMDSLVFNFFPTYVVIGRPYVKGWDKDNPRRSVSADKVTVYLGLAALMSREVQVKRVQVDEPSLDIVKLPSGGYNIDPLVKKVLELAALKPGEKVKPGGVSEVVLFDASIAYTDPEKRIVVALDKAGFDLRSRPDGSYWAGYNVKDTLVKRPGAPPFHLSLKGDTLYKDGKLSISGLKAGSGVNSLSVSGDIIAKASPVLDLKLDAKADLALLDKLAIWKHGPAGEVQVKGSLKGAYPDLTGAGSLTLKKASYSGFKVDDLTSELAFEKGALSVPGIKSRLFGGEVEGGVVVDFSGKTEFTSSWTLKGLQTAQYAQGRKDLSFLPPQTVSGKLDVRGRGLGTPDIQASGSLDIVRAAQTHPLPGVNRELQIIKSAHVEFSLADGIVSVDKGTVSAENSSVDLGGTVGLDGRADLVIKGRSSNVSEIAALIGDPNVQGNLDFTGYAQGKITEPVIIGKAQITGARAHGMPFQSAYGDVKLSGWVISFKDFNVSQGQGSFLVNGSIAFKGEGATPANPVFSAKVGVKDVDARKIIPIFTSDIPVNLKANGDISFDGTTSKFRGEAHLTSGGGDVYGHTVDKAEVQAVLTEKEIKFPKVVAVRDRDIITANGGIRFDGTFYGKASSARLDVANFAKLIGTGVPVKGSVSLSVSGEGSFKRPEIKANVTAYKLYMGDVDLGAGTASARIRNDVMTLTGSLMEDKVLADGFLSFEKPYRWRGRLAFEGGRFEPFIRLLYKKLPEDASLVSTGSVVAEGALDEPSKTSVSAKFSKLKAALLGRRLENRGDLDFAYADGKLAVKSFNLTGDKVDLEVSGGASGPEHMDLAVKAKMDLDPLKRLAKDSVDFLDGTAIVDMRLRGTLSEPVITGRARVQGGGIKLKEFQQRFDNIEAAMEFDGSGFKLAGLTGDLGGGKVTAHGSGSLKGFSVDNYSLDMTARDVRVKYFEELPTTIDADLNVEGVETKNAVSGDITVKRARYTERIDWKSWLVQFQKTRNEAPAPGPAAFGQTALNLHIVSVDSIKIENNVAKIPVSADFYVRGTANKPVFLGRFEASSGSVYFRNNEFKLISAAAEFADPKKLNPILDLQAETKVKEYQIQLNLTGTMDKLKVTLMSDPPLEDADIISLLTFGRTSEGLKGHETAITTGEAASFVTGQIQDAVESRVRRLTGFDRFQIDPYLPSTGTQSGPRVTVGKGLMSDKLYITYSSNLGSSENQFVRLEYVFNKNLSLVGERDELGRYGGDLKFKFEFR